MKAAEEQSRLGNIDKAISEYKLHMREREQNKARPDWENPSFYLILIGDLELHRGNIDAALKNYLAADEAKVDAGLVCDRLRSAAKWYEDKGELAQAFALLNQHRTRDPLLFDPTLDRLAKRMTENEETVGKDVLKK